MNNNFKTVFKDFDLTIPAYQRAYSWGEAQVKQLIDDLQEVVGNKTRYYLGHFILEKNGGKLDIIDGQQRLTTIALFFKYAGKNLPFTLNVVEYDDKYFQDLNKCTVDSDDKFATSSQKRMYEAMQYFKTNLTNLDEAMLKNYCDVINQANCSLVQYNTKAVATQIFELHNSRGIRLTETEKIKVILIRYVYANASDDDKEHKVSLIQSHFATILKLEENIPTIRSQLKLDNIFMYHLRAIDDGNKHDDFYIPRGIEGENGIVNYVKGKIQEKDSNKEIAVEYAMNLAEKFAKTMQLLCEDIKKDDKSNPIIGDIVLLDQGKALTFLLRFYHFRTQAPSQNLMQDFEKLLLLWDWHDAYYKSSSTKRGHFFTKIYYAISYIDNKSIENLEDFVKECITKGGMLYHRDYRMKEPITTIVKDFLWKEECGKLKQWAYWENKLKIQYLLYKYEISLCPTSRDTLRKSFSKGITLEHMVARSTEVGEQLSKEFEKVPINGIGNLVLLPNSVNASVSNNLPAAKVKMYIDKGFDFESYKTFSGTSDNIDTETFDIWTTKINERNEKIVKFLEKDFLA